MYRFKNPKLQVTFTEPTTKFVGKVNLPRCAVHTWLCTSDIHANNIIGRILNKHDPFQQRTHLPLHKVYADLVSLDPDLSLLEGDSQTWLDGVAHRLSA